VRKAENLTTILCHCHEMWEPNFLEPSGSLQACNGAALPLTVGITDVRQNSICSLNSNSNVLVSCCWQYL